MNTNGQFSSSFCESMLECKSQDTYDKWFKKYADFAATNNAEHTSFSVFMDWIIMLSKTYKVLTLSTFT